MSVFSENKPGHFENLPPLGTTDPYEVMYTVNMFKIFASSSPVLGSNFCSFIEVMVKMHWPPFSYFAGKVSNITAVPTVKIHRSEDRQCIFRPSLSRPFPPLQYGCTLDTKWASFLLRRRRGWTCKLPE